MFNNQSLYCKLSTYCAEKDFENLPIFGEDMDKSCATCILTHCEVSGKSKYRQLTNYISGRATVLMGRKTGGVAWWCSGRASDS